MLDAPSRLLAVVLAATAFMAPAAGSDAPERSLRADGWLADYVAMADPAFGWRERGEGRIGEVEYVELMLTSQAWRGMPWHHQLFVLRPSDPATSASQALLFIDGGSWRDDYAADAVDAEDLPDEAEYFAALAELLGAPVAVLRQVPFQPMFDGLTEDRLIAKTFDAFLETGEPDWPLLGPMVRSAVRAMDAVKAVTAEHWSLEIDGFTVTGASKRGWTTWLTAAVDPRVKALAPIVIDVLNIEAHLELAETVWGEHSQQIAPYTERGLHRELQTERGQALLDLVDPFRQREALDQPKLIILGTNDEYWPLEALNLYWDQLEGDNHVLYMPNSGHRVRDRERIVAGIAALHLSVANDAAMPALDWTFDIDDEGLTVTLAADPAPRHVRAWTAGSDGPDMRNAEWSSSELELDGDRTRHRLARSPERYQAMFLEVKYDGPGGVPLYLTTTLRQLPPAASALAGGDD